MVSLAIRDEVCVADAAKGGEQICGGVALQQGHDTKADLRARRRIALPCFVKPAAAKAN